MALPSQDDPFNSKSHAVDAKPNFCSVVTQQMENCQMKLEVIGADGKSRGFVDALEGMETMQGKVTKVTKVTAKTISINGKQIRINPPSIRPSKVPKGAKLLKKA
jgi:hypothetical protein